MRPSIAFIYVSILSVGLCAQSPTDPTEALRLYAEAEKAFGKGNYEAADSLTDQGILLAEQLGKNTALPRLCILKGDFLMERSKFTEALAPFTRALKTATEFYGEEDTLVATALNYIGITYIRLGQYDQAQAYLDKSLVLRKLLYGEYHADVSQTLNNLAIIYRIRCEYARAEKCFEQALAIGKKTLPPGNPDLASYYINLGVVNRERGQYTEALSCYRKSLELVFALEDPGLKAKAYNNMAVCYRELGDFAQARLYYDQSLDILRKKYGENHSDVAIILDNIGVCEAQQSNVASSLSHYEQALAIRKQIYGEKHESIAYSLQNIASLLSEQNQLPQAESYARQALQIFLEVFGENNQRTARVYTILGEIARRRGEFKAARLWLDRSSRIFSALGGAINPEWATALAALGEVAYEQKDYEASERYLNQALSALPPEDLGHQVQYKSFLAHVLFTRSKNLYNPDRLKESFRMHQQALTLMDSLRTHYRMEGSRQELQEKARLYFDKALLCAWECYEKTGERQYLDQAFRWTESSRTLLLYEAIRAFDALRLGHIPMSLQQAERDLRMGISATEKKITSGQSRKADQLAFNQQQLFRLRHSYDSLLREIETHYPAYFQLRYGKDYASSRETEQKLAPGTALLNYYIGDSLQVVFVSTHEGTRWYRLPSGTALGKDIFSFREALTKYQNSDALAWSLYKQLLSPADHLPEKLIIIPDDVLGYLPFDALLSEMPAPDVHPRNKAYLLRRHTLSYAFSATLWLREVPQEHTSDGLLAFAPEFPPLAYNESNVSVRDKLGALPYSRVEAEAIVKLMGGRLVTDAEASELTFDQLAPQYRMIHLSGHANVNDQDPMRSRIAFTPGTGAKGTDDFLELSEVFLLPLRADLVVLSACETGIGQLQRGEGIASLARGFAYAGARSIVTTLWQVNDAASAKIMQRFYAFLKEGLPKDEALRRARLEYLEQADAGQASPYFWAGFVPIGDMAPLPGSMGFQSRMRSFAVGLLLILAAAGLLMSFTRSALLRPREG